MSNPLQKYADAIQYYFAKYIGFTSKDRIEIYKKMASYIRTKFSESQALNLLYEDYSQDGKKPNEASAYVLKNVSNKIENGESFGEAIAPWVPVIDATMLSAGSKTDIVGALEDCVNLYKKKKAINKSLSSGITQPLVTLAALIGFMIYYATSILPQFMAVLPLEKWTGLPLYIANASIFMVHNLLYMLVFAAVAVVIISWSIPNWTGRTRLFFDRFPPWSLYKIYTGASFMLTYSSLINVDFTPEEALRQMSSTSSKWMREKLDAAAIYIREGKDIGDSLKNTRMQFPDAKTVRDICAYCKADGFEENLRNVANEWIDNAEENVNNISKILNQITMAALGGLVGAIAMSTMQLQGQISSFIQSGVN